MKPGPHPWATNDAWASGPDSGNDAKTEPLTAHKEDGYYRSRRPAPDILNWQLNRGALAQQALARMQAMNYQKVESTSAFGSAYTLEASCHTKYPTVDNVVCLFFHNAAGNISEYIGYGGGRWLAPASNPAPSISNTITDLDADADFTGRRIIVARGGAATDFVKTAANFGAAAWGSVSWTGGAPLKQFISIGCDCDTAAAGVTKWLIGDEGVGGTVAPVVWVSTNGSSFGLLGSIGLGIGQRIYSIQHSRHAAGALGPDDPGNPTWLVLTDARAAISANGASWNDYAHGFATAPTGKRVAAYSKTARRWVVVHENPSSGDVSYSDNNGASWTLLSGALPSSGAMSGMPIIKSDGFGTFVITDQTTSKAHYWVSTDEGLTWTYCSLGTLGVSGPTTGLDAVALEVCTREDVDVDETSDFATSFILAYHDDAGPLLECFRSLMG